MTDSARGTSTARVEEAGRSGSATPLAIANAVTEEQPYAFLRR